MDIANTDNIVGEYLIYRGFTQTYKSLKNEMKRDKTRQFEVPYIVDSIFQYLHNYDILNFISLWDFMNKRFFLHLDSDHMQMSVDIKADIIKYYLINAFKHKEKDKIIEFFSMYSHEILNDSGVGKLLRNWFALPYMEAPQDDPEFSVYFTQKWIDSLILTLKNFLSIVLSTAPPPKLLLLERWFRSEAQQEIRSQLKQSFVKVDLLVDRLEKNEERLHAMREVIKDLSTQVIKASFGGSSRGTVGLFETDEEAEGRRVKVKELGQIVCKLALECANKGKHIQSLTSESKLREILGSEAAEIYYSHFNTLTEITSYEDNNNSLEDLEKQLIDQIQLWIKALSV